MKIEKYKKYGKTLYKFRASLGYDVYGKQIKVYRSGFETKKEAELAYAKVVTFYERNKRQVIKPTKELLMDEIFKEFYEIKKLEVKESTLLKIERAYKYHIQQLFGSEKINDISPQAIQEFANNLFATYITGDKYFQLFKSILNFATKKDYLKKDLLKTVITPKKKTKEESTNFYTKRELKLFLELAKEQLSHQWYVFFYTLAHTGIRRGEALALQWDCVFHDHLVIRRTMSHSSKGHIISNITKTTTSHRKVLIDEEVYNLLMTLKDDNSDFVFQNTKGNFCTSSQPIRQLHKMKGIKYISPHGFRHTHCSLLFSAGVGIPEVQKRLGHADISTTIQIYNHVYKEDEMKALKKYKNFLLEE